MLKIGISACFFHEDPKRAIFKGMTLQYIEQNVAHWLMQRDVLAFMVPSPEGRTRRAGSKATVDAYAQELDGLVLMGGSDVCPGVLRREGAAARMERRPHPRRLRDRAAARVHGAAKARARRLPRRAGDQRRAGRNALPGPRDAGAARAQPPQLGDLRGELPRDVVRAGQRPRPAVPRDDARQDQLDPPSGGEGARPRPRRRGLVGARSHRRGDPLYRVRPTCSRSSGIRNSTRRTIRPSSTTRRSSTNSSPRPRSTRPPRTRSERRRAGQAARELRSLSEGRRVAPRVH